MSVDDVEIKLPGPLRRNAGIFLGVGVMLLISPVIGRFLADYRAVVLEIKDDRMLVAEVSRPAKWVAHNDAKPGDMVVKNLGEWAIQTVPATGGDRELQGLFKRYNHTYEGVIVEIKEPLAPGSAKVAVVKVDGSDQLLHVPLWSDKLAGAAPGLHIMKQSGQWDPVLVHATP